MGLPPHSVGSHNLSRLWIAPQPQREGKTPKSKHPPELAVSLVTQVWDSLEALWSKRNELLRSPESALLNKVDRDCKNRFLEFKRTQTEWFRSTHRFMIDVPL